MLLEGEPLLYSEMDIQKATVVLRWSGKTTNVEKSNILCVIPENKKSGYTFMVRNNKKMMFGRKFIQNNYQGEDVVKMLAAKHYKSDVAAELVHQQHPVEGVSREGFIALFNETQKKITSSTIVSLTLASVALILGIVSLMSTLNEMQMYSQIDLDSSAPATLPIITEVDHNTQIVYLAWKDVA